MHENSIHTGGVMMTRTESEPEFVVHLSVFSLSPFVKLNFLFLGIFMLFFAQTSMNYYYKSSSFIYINSNTASRYELPKIAMRRIAIRQPQLDEISSGTRKRSLGVFPNRISSRTVSKGKVCGIVPEGNLNGYLVSSGSSLGRNNRRGSLLVTAMGKNRAHQNAKVLSDSSSDAATRIDSGSSENMEPLDSSLVYQGVIFDMDGTLSVSCIDYVRMRKALDIPVGDLFTVMETWKDGSRIKQSLETILEIEAEAAALSQAMPGLHGLLDFLKRTDIKVGLVTRNTSESVDAFFEAIGNEWRDAFDIILTREYRYVKPDKRCLLHFATEWGIPPYRLLMVGDSVEDVECGNAAGTATCLIAGGGNEISDDDDEEVDKDQKREQKSKNVAPLAGAVPTFTVNSLAELQERLERRDTSLGWGAYRTGTIDLSDDNLSSSNNNEIDEISSNGIFDVTESLDGAPPPGLSFLDWLLANGYVETAACSFPRLDAARYKVPPDEHPGSKVLHLQCATGALTKLLFSAGLLVVGVDREAHLATKRGIFAASVSKLPTPGSLKEAESVVGAFDAVVLFGEEDYENFEHARKNAATQMQDIPLENQIWMDGSLQEIRRVLKKGGKLSMEIFGSESFICTSLAAAGYKLCTMESLYHLEDGLPRLRVVAEVE